MTAASPKPSPAFAGVEAGGTKFVCAIGTGSEPALESRIEFATSDPETTMSRVVEWVGSSQVMPAGIGLASFGPVDLRQSSPTYGCLLSTPKDGWSGFDLVGFMRASLPGVPVGLDTDVNAAAMAEQAWGAAQGSSCAVYLTVGTGIGGGVVVRNGIALHGLMHPEIGHMRVPHDRALDPFDGICPYHGDCWEGLAAGPAIERRWGRPGAELPPDHAAWEMEAAYLATGLTNLVVVLSPEKIVVGGGVGSTPGLLDRIRIEVERLLAGYVPVIRDMRKLIVAPALGRDSGVLGAIALGRAASLS